MSWIQQLIQIGTVLMPHLINTFDGEALYLDTNALYLVVRAIEPAARTLLKAVQRGEFRAYTSALTFDELAYQLLLRRIRDEHLGSPHDYLRQKGNEVRAIAKYYPDVRTQLQRLQRLPNLNVVGVSALDVNRMHNAILAYQLRPRDALHFAAMHKVNCLHIASEDGDFDRVPQLQRYTLR